MPEPQVSTLITRKEERRGVWASSYGDRGIGTFLPGTLNEEMYLDVLENTVDPMLTDIIENDERFLEECLRFQHDDADPH